MFSKLKEKLKSWTQKFTKEVVEETPEEIELPKKFDAGQQQYLPDTEKIKKKIEAVEKKERKKKSKKEIKEERKVTNKIWKDIKKEAKDNSIKFPEETQKEIIPLTNKNNLDEQDEILDEEQEKKSFFARIKEKLSIKKISEEEFNVYAEELEMLLLENNVALEVAEKIIRDLKEKIVGREFLKKEIEGQINETIKDILRKILIEPFDLIEKIKEKKEPYVILFCGINGTGKTTTIAKIAQHLKDKKISCVLAAADTFRAASIEQIKKHGEKLGIKVIANEYGSDPASVGFDAIQYAKKNHIKCVLIDTAGRMHSSKNLLQELEKIVRICKPDTKIFVGESITGNDAVEQIKSFNFAIGIDGIVLSKADIDEKGGTALSVGYVTKKPILFLGTGQEYDKIEPFNKEKFIEKLGL